jgi:hypothetical protein
MRHASLCGGAATRLPAFTGHDTPCDHLYFKKSGIWLDLSHQWAADAGGGLRRRPASGLPADRPSKQPAEAHAGPVHG